MRTLKELKRLLRQEHDGLPAVRAALVGDSATQLLATALRGTAVERGFVLDLYEAGYNQVERQLLDPGSELHAHRPEYVVLFQSTHRLASLHASLPPSARTSLADERLAFVAAQADALAADGCRLLVLNYPELDDAVYGSYANRAEESLTWQVRKLNYGLMQLAREHRNLYVCDLCALQAKLGRDFMFAPNIYTSTEMLLSVDCLPHVAARIADVVCAVGGQVVRKCLILDLDNTLWGGVIGDDGLEGIQLGHGLGIGKAYTEFQQWVKKLRQRGIIICICSKNDDAKAREPFERHPDMVLSLDDIAVFCANWESKPANIRTIKEVLGIGYDSMVFIDDNPFERAMVREQIDGITVPDMPTDPAEWLEFLYGLNLFETASSSQADADRTRQYQVEAERVRLSRTYADEDAFLASLGMVSTVSGFTPFNTPRVAQLSQRSNQFNLRTVRYTEADLAAIAADPGAIGLCLTLADRLGDNGLVAVVVMRRADDADTLFVENWFMSCRVLKRGMEAFTLNAMATAALAAGCRHIVAEYLPTARNGMVADLCPTLGMTPVAGSGHRWRLDLDGYAPRHCHITQQ